MQGEPAIHATPHVVEAIEQADLIVLGPGSLYSSILPNLMTGRNRSGHQTDPGGSHYICNIMTQLGRPSTPDAGSCPGLA